MCNLCVAACVHNRWVALVLTDSIVSGQACATIVRVLSDFLPRNKGLSYRAVAMETEARTNMAALHYQGHTKIRRAKAALALDPTNAELKV